MRLIPDQLSSKNLVPFKKRHGKYNIPGMTWENPVSMESVDTDLSAEERGYIRHFLGYADTLLRSAPASEDLGEPQEAESPPDNIVIEKRCMEERPAEEPRTEAPPAGAMEQPVKLEPGKEDSSQAA
jgi:hypothetical protein